MDECWYNFTTGISIPCSCRKRAINCKANNELPPRSKKLSFKPILSIRSNCDQSCEIFFSVIVEGATNAIPISGRDSSGLGNARRSILPLGVLGNADKKTNDEGIIYSGNLPAINFLMEETEG